MSEGNAAINEKNGYARQRQKPVEDGTAVLRQVDESKAAEEELQNDHSEGPALAVNICEKLGGHAWVEGQRVT